MSSTYLPEGATDKNSQMDNLMMNFKQLGGAFTSTTNINSSSSQTNQSFGKLVDKHFKPLEIEAKKIKEQ